MKMLKDSKAVSPVIGVMLMLVVTVILAAAVSSTSTGLMKSTDAAPTAIFDVECVKDVDAGWGMGNMSYLQIKEVTGDAIPTNDLKIVISADSVVTETLPNVTNMNFQYASYTTWVDTAWNETAWNETTQDYTGDYAGDYVTVEGDTVTGCAPYWNNPSVGYAGDDAVNFGAYTVKPGVAMVADEYENYVYGTDGTSGIASMISNWDELSSGDFINVKIIHLPTQKVIFATNVEVV